MVDKDRPVWILKKLVIPCNIHCDTETQDSVLHLGWRQYNIPTGSVYSEKLTVRVDSGQKFDRVGVRIYTLTTSEVY